MVQQMQRRVAVNLESLPAVLRLAKVFALVRP
jgi:hypothetical protein